MQPWQIAMVALAGSVACSLMVWSVSVVRHNVALADRAWSVLIMVSAAVFVLGLPPLRDRLVVMLLLGAAWALRLSLFITWRSWGQLEERRYREMRQRNQPHFAWKSLYLVFGLQALLAWLVAMPFLAAAAAPGTADAWSGLDSLGLAVALFGLLFEAKADAQMAAFKAGLPKAGLPKADTIMDRGLWRYSRHPNYFGESCFWWGIACLAVAAGGAWWAWLSPVLVTFLLLRVSGVNLQEQHLRSRGPRHVEYAHRTSAFLPWPPKGIASR
jgi:steroid 5-alpha reductase family enzyme